MSFEDGKRKEMDPGTVGSDPSGLDPEFYSDRDNEVERKVNKTIQLMGGMTTEITVRLDKLNETKFVDEKNIIEELNGF